MQHTSRGVSSAPRDNVQFIQDTTGARVWLRESPMQLEVSASTEPANFFVGVQQLTDVAPRLTRAVGE